LDWGDIQVLTAAFTVEPLFQDEGNFAHLCGVSQKRWARNEKLESPAEPGSLDQ
jgi:hypothetical protein